MDITVRFTDVQIAWPEGKRPPDAEIEKFVAELISDALNMKPIAGKGYVSSYSMQAEIDDSLDRELSLLRMIIRGFKDVDQKCRERILNYLFNRFGK